ncbi:MAG: PAS domain S-box protein, partial [Rhodocyclaceae bacterium]
MTANAIRFARTRWILLTIMLSLIVPLIAASIVGLHGPQIERETKTNLEVVARLKAEQVERWLTERISNSQVIAANSAIIELIAEQQRSASPERLERIRRWLDAVREGGNYPAAHLIDVKGKMLLALGEPHDLAAETMSLLPVAFADNKVVNGDIHLEKEDGLPALSLVVPLQRTVNGKKLPVGAVILHIHPDQSIFPLILAWPAATTSAETLLVRREGESVVFLNQLRHTANSTLKLQRPLDNLSLPAAVAVFSNTAGTLRGVDYLGAEVLAAYRPVSGTNWHIVAKIDRDEAMRPLWSLVFWITLVASAALAAVLLALALLWRQQKRAELSQLVRESEARFRAVAHTARDAIITTDVGGRIVDWNPAAEHLFGYSAAEVSGQELTLIIPQRFQKAAMKGFRRMLNGDPERRDGSSAELITQRKDGQEVLVERAVALWETTTGRFFTTTMRDIGPRRREEENNRRLLAENETILRNALVGIVYLKRRRVVSCNRRFEEILGYGPGELIGESSQRFYDSQETFEALGERAYSALLTTTNYTEEVMLRRKDGHLFPGALNGCAIDPAHPNEGSIWIYADISERRQAEQESRKLLQAIEQASVSIVITNCRGIIEYVNPAFTRVTGYSRNEAIGNNPSILKSGTTLPSVYQDLWQSISAGKVWQDVLLNRRKDGETIWEDTSISPLINDHGEITHYVAVKEDVTERVRVQQQLIDHHVHLEEMVEQRTVELSAALAEAKIADQAKDTFLANITHELRTPLSAVIGFSGLARPLSTDPRQREYLDKITSAGKTLSAVIDDLLDLSKIAAGRMTLEASTFSLRQLLARSRSTISFKAEEKGLQLIERIDDEIPDALLGDSLRLEQILLNLLSNAVKFTAAGQIEMRIGLHARTTERVCLNIEVQDSGIGMRAEDLDLLFKPFSQTDASMSRKFGGTGLGLAICKRLANLMDGEIDVSSLEGSGT